MSAALLAIGILAAVGQTSPGAPQGVLELVKAGRFAEAEPHLRRMVESDPTPDLRYLLGLCLVGQYRYGEAERFLRRAVRDEPRRHAWLHTLAKSLIGQGKSAAAVDVLERAVALSPLPEYRFSLAMSALDGGDLDRAERELRACLESGAPLTFYENGRTVDRTAEPLFELGKIRMIRGDLAESRQLFQRALAIEPSHREARFQLGIVQRKLRRLEDAAASFERVLAEQPRHRGALQNLHGVRVALGRHKQAEAIAQELTRVNVLENEIQFHLSSAEAIEHRLQAGSETPGLESELVDKRLTLGSLLLEVGRSDDAIEHLLAARRIAPERPDLYRALAAAFRAEGRLSDAALAESLAEQLEAIKNP